MIYYRCSEYMKVLFEMADCDVLYESVQADLPTELCPVHMVALVQKRRDSIRGGRDEQCVIP